MLGRRGAGGLWAGGLVDATVAVWAVAGGTVALTARHTEIASRILPAIWSNCRIMPSNLQNSGPPVHFNLAIIPIAFRAIQGNLGAKWLLKKSPNQKCPS